MTTQMKNRIEKIKFEKKMRKTTTNTMWMKNIHWNVTKIGLLVKFNKKLAKNPLQSEGNGRGQKYYVFVLNKMKKRIKITD